MTYHPLLEKLFPGPKPRFSLNSLKILVCVYLLSLTFGSMVLYSPTCLAQSSTELKLGNDAFLEQKYDLALHYYRQHLRANPDDAATWNLVGATYYHMAQPRRALQILKRYRAQAKPRSHNLFYQGLAHDAIGQTATAIRFLTAAAKFQDPFAALATFELVTIHIESRQNQIALQWIEYYQKNFPDGPHKSQVQTIQQQLGTERSVNITDSQRHQYRLGLYRNHPLSLIDTPHFWMIYLGHDYAIGARTNPAIAPDRRPIVDTSAQFEDASLAMRAAFGLGPYYNQETRIYLAYYYKQDWGTNRDRLRTFLSDASDFNYFPYRPDLQVRTHRLLLDLDSKLHPDWNAGVYSHLDFVRAGSSLYPAPERPEVRKSLNVSYSTSLVPWISWAFMDKQNLIFYGRFDKTIDQEQSDFSNQSYRIFDSSSPFVSIGGAYEGSFLQNRLHIRTDIYRFRKVFNDSWEDHIQTGGIAKAGFRLNPRWSLMARLGLYRDDYALDQIKTNSCDFETFLGDITDLGVTCPRIDRGQLAQASIHYAPRPNYVWMASAAYRNHENPELKVYNERRVDLIFSFSMGFPNIRDNLGILNRFTETSLIYEGF